MKTPWTTWTLPCILSLSCFLPAQTPEVGNTPLVLKQAEVRVPMAEAGPAGLYTKVILPLTPGRHPLVLMTHGSAYRKGSNEQIGPGIMQPQAIWFARRGYVVAMVTRRGYGASGGTMEKLHYNCASSGFDVMAKEEAADLTAVYNAMNNLAQVDGQNVIVTGNSAGGFAALAFGAHAPPALKAVINFSGGWHSMFFTGSCMKDGLVPEMQILGAATHVPTLWLYAKNDGLFAPKYVDLMHDAFTSTGAVAEMPAIGNSASDGHYLFSEGVRTWAPLVEDFLKRHDLPWQDLDPNYGEKLLKLPDTYPGDMKAAFKQWQKLGPNKAFAIGPRGEWAYSSGRKTLKIAKDEALDHCRNSECKVIAFEGQ